MAQNRFSLNRRDIIRVGGVGTVTALAGCVEGEIVDVSYDCAVDEPQNIPEATRPQKGDPNADVEIEFFQAYSSPPTGIFVLNRLRPIIEEYVETGKAHIKFHDYPLNQNTTWANQLASVGRYIHAVHGDDTYLNFIYELHRAQAYDRSNLWQSIGDAAKEIGADPCATITHGSWKTYEEDSEVDKSYAKSLGIEQAPTTIINGERLNNNRPEVISQERMREAIKAELESK